jgi:hypothetical protein
VQRHIQDVLVVIAGTGQNDVMDVGNVEKKRFLGVMRGSLTEICKCAS